MKLTICFLLFCVLYAGATTKSCGTVDAALDTPSSERILAQGLEMVLAKLAQMDRKLVQLHFELNEHKEVVDRNRASQEKTIVDLLWAVDSIKKDVGRNISLLQDQSLLILAQQSACASHEQFREKWFNFTTKDNEGAGWMQSQEDTSISFAALYKSRMTGCDTSTSASSQRESMPAISTTSATTTLPTTTTTSTTTTTPKPQVPSYSSCRNVPSNVSGVYLISPNKDSASFNVYCEQEKFEGGWIVMQHRFDGSVDFYRNWTQYREGFGELDSEFWLGLERIHQLTTARAHELIVEVRDFHDNYGYARYSSFHVDSESENYKLKVLGSYSDTAGNSMNYLVGRMFSTLDRDNDGNSDINHAVTNHGAWWYPHGNWSNLNGPYKNTTDCKGNWWHSLKNDCRGLRFARMMIRELK